MPRKKNVVPEDISKNGRHYVEALDSLEPLFRPIYHGGGVKILLCLVRAYRSNYGLTYTQLSELTGLKKRQFDYPANSLKKEGLIRIITTKEPSTNTIFEPTDAGIIMARGLVKSIITFVKPLVENKKIDEHPVLAEAFEAFKQLEDSLENQGMALTVESMSPDFKL